MIPVSGSHVTVVHTAGIVLVMKAALLAILFTTSLAASCVPLGQIILHCEYIFSSPCFFQCFFSIVYYVCACANSIVLIYRLCGKMRKVHKLQPVRHHLIQWVQEFLLPLHALMCRILFYALFHHCWTCIMSACMFRWARPIQMHLQKCRIPCCLSQPIL